MSQKTEPPSRVMEKKRDVCVCVCMCMCFLGSNSGALLVLDKCTSELQPQICTYFLTVTWLGNKILSYQRYSDTRSPYWQKLKLPLTNSLRIINEAEVKQINLDCLWNISVQPYHYLLKFSDKREKILLFDDPPQAVKVFKGFKAAKLCGQRGPIAK